MQIRCFCGQSFTIPEDTLWTWGCYVCGRKLSVTAEGKLLELAIPKPDPEQPDYDQHVSAVAAALPSTRPVALSCKVCGADLHGLCSWCGEPHCWLHTPKGHPGPLPPITGPEVDLQLPLVLYVAVPVVVGAVGLLIWALL